MGDKLLIRAYNVGLGDCIYVRIPDPVQPFHMLIDCGTWSDSEWLRKAIKDLKNDLPYIKKNGRKKQVLDLLVVTHRHHDHLSGFGLNLFKDIEIKQLWVSAAMDENHPQAKGLHAFSAEVQKNLTLMQPLFLDPVLASEVKRNQIPDQKAVKTLLTGLGVKPDFVHANTSKKKLKLRLKEAEIHILAPERDIDRYYLGKISTKKGAKAFDGTLDAPLGMNELNEAALAAGGLKPGKIPKDLKISNQDFEQLRNRMMASALYFAHVDNSFRNNTSVVLMIEWRGRRLLFPGDAEWHGEFTEGNQNGSWNVMWQRGRLKGSIDFLKVGHHGSRNATPWKATPNSHEVNKILDEILPPPKGRKRATAKAIVSTERGRYKPIPGVELVKALGKRVRNSVIYDKKLSADQIENLNRLEIERQTLGDRQPARTDFEYLVTGDNFAEVEFVQVKNWKP